MPVRKLSHVAATLLALSLSGRAAASPPGPLPAATQAIWGAPPALAELMRIRPPDVDVLEVVVPGLPDTAMAEMTLAGPVIFYNPVLFRAAGEAGEFVRAHELAHVRLDHVENERMLSTDEGRAEAEAEADCFAARTSSPGSVTAMARLLLRRPPEARDAIYGTKPERARRILACAGLAGG